MSKVTVATIWMDGCSGCHMSLLDIDERIIDLAEHIEIVYSPLVDNKHYPEAVDVAIIEGAVAYDEDYKKLKKIRARTKIIVALGDCAVAGNVPTMRNPFPVTEVLEHSYIETATANQQIPTENIPALLPYVKPLHDVIDIDVFVQGCPPSADTIYYVLSELVAGRTPDLRDKTRPGA
jgi:NAD-reducing hydrogenase small subunit